MKKHTKRTKHNEIIEDIASKAITITIIATLYCAIFINPFCLFIGLIIWLFIGSFFDDSSLHSSDFTM